MEFSEHGKALERVVLHYYNGVLMLHLSSLFHQVGFKNMQNVEHVPLSLDKAMRLVKDVFISAAERDVYTGDALRICIVTKEGIREETVPLRKD